MVLVEEVLMTPHLINSEQMIAAYCGGSRDFVSGLHPVMDIIAYANLDAYADSNGSMPYMSSRVERNYVPTSENLVRIQNDYRLRSVELLVNS